MVGVQELGKNIGANEHKYRGRETAILKCLPPRGNPKPTVTWLKDGKVVETSALMASDITEMGLSSSQYR